MNSYSYSSKEFLIVENLKTLATDMTPEPFLVHRFTVHQFTDILAHCLRELNPIDGIGIEWLNENWKSARVAKQPTLIKMPTTSKAQTRAETAQLAQFLFAAAQIAEDFDNEDLGGDLEEDCQEIDADSDMIELVATNALAHVFAMSGDGS